MAPPSGSEWYPSNWFQQNWINSIKHAYENMGYTFKNFVTPPVKVDGTKMIFPIAGFGKASKYTRGDKVQVMNVAGGQVEVDTETFDAAAFEYVQDRADLGMLAEATKDLISKQQSGALGRQHDESIILAIHKHKGKYGEVIGSFDEPWSLDKNMQVRRRLRANNVPLDGQINAFMPSTAFLQCMGYKQFTEQGYQGPRYPLIGTAAPQTFLNINWHELPDDVFQHMAVENSSNADGAKNGFTWYIWHKMAVGSGEQFSKKTDFEYQAMYKRWFYNDFISVGAVPLHDWEKDLGMKHGIIECRMNNASPVNFHKEFDIAALAELIAA